MNTRILQQIKARIICGEKRLKNPFYKSIQLAGNMPSERIYKKECFRTCQRRLRRMSKK